MAALLYQWLMVSAFSFLPTANKPAPVPPHPFYISVTEVAHNPAEKSLEISCKFFSDDLEETLEKNFNSILDITKEADKARFNKLLPAYVGRHLQFVVDGRPVSLSFVGFEVEKESTYCYFEVANVASAKQIAILNSLLHDFQKEQINILHVTVNGKRQSTKLDYPDTRAVLNF